MECLHGGESDKGLEEGALKGSLLHTGGYVLQLEEGSLHTYVRTYIHSTELVYSLTQV